MSPSKGRVFIKICLPCEDHRKKTEEGFNVYSLEDLAVGKGNAGSIFAL